MTHSTKPIINPAFIEQVRRLREGGWEWNEIVELTGASVQTCRRALRKHEQQGPKLGPKLGPKQTVILQLIRKHGLITMEQLRDHSGFTGDIIGRITARLIELGLVERPVRNYYRPTHHD